MNKTEILVTGRNETIMQAIVALINTNSDWQAVEAATGEEAIEKFHQRNFDMVVYTDGTTEEEERKLRKIFTIQNPGITILKGDSDDSTLLTTRIEAALEKQRKDKKPSFSFTDDALKNAGLNIIVQ